MKKICSKCQQEKVLEKDFYKDSSSVTGYRSYCKLCSKEMSSVYQKKNWESVKNKHYEWVANHPEHKKYQSIYFKKYQQLSRFKKKNREYQKKYARTEKGRYAGILRTNRYRQRSRALINDLTYEQLLQIKESQQNKCAICHRDFNKKLPYELDHIVPVAESKPGDPGLTKGNVQLLCRTCNASKNKRTVV